MTHYIPYDSPRNGKQAIARCGVWVEARTHANAPTCPDCLAGLAADDADDAEIRATLAAAEARNAGGR